jgi:hypothetical protein
MNKAQEMLIWLFFTVGFALTPLYANWIVLHTDTHYAWYWLFRHGEIYLVSGAFAADSISRILRKTPPLGFPDLLIVAVCIYVLFGSTMEFGTAAPRMLLEPNAVPMGQEQSVRSLYYLGCMIVAGLGSLV